MAENITLLPKGEFVSSLSPQLIEKAERELNEKTQWRQRDIDALRDMLDKRRDIYFRSDDAFLLRFLRAKKFDYDRAFQMLVNYYEVKKSYPDIYRDMLPSKLQDVWEENLQGALSCRDDEGRRIIILRPGRWNSAKFSIIKIIKANFLTVEKLLEDEETQVNGVVIIIDLSGFGFYHATQLGPVFAKKVTSIFQNAMPVRIKGIHYINEPRIFDALFAILRPFLKEKLKQRIHVHGSDYSSLHDYIPASVLPADYGGEQAKYSSKEWMEYMLQFEQEFIENNKYGVLDQELKEIAHGEDNL